MEARFRRGEGFSGADLDFLVAAAAPGTRDPARLKRVLAQDKDFRNAFIEDDRTARMAISDRDVFLKISPRLYFEILLRTLRRELSGASHTLETGGCHKVAVFDARQVVGLLERPSVLPYLADMLASFTRVESGSFSWKTPGAGWRRGRFDDTDVDGLVRFLEFAGDEYRLDFYKRIADVCLFLLGVFPEHVQASSRVPPPGDARPRLARRAGRTPEEYEEEGRKYYKLAAEHPEAKDRELSDVFLLLHDGFQAARKPLALIAERYLRAPDIPRIGD